MNSRYGAFSFSCLVVVCVFIFILGAQPGRCGNQQTLRIGLYENKPKIYSNPDGKPSGFWPELIDHIAQAEKWTIQYIPGNWNQGLERLSSGQIDVMPDVAFTEERRNIYKFNENPILVSWSRIYTRHDDTTITSITDLKDKRIAVLRGSVNFKGTGGLEEIVQSFNISCTFVPFDSYDRVFDAVANNLVHAGVTNRNFGNRNQARDERHDTFKQDFQY